MKTKTITQLLAAGSMLLGSSYALAATVTEGEPNNTVTAAQKVTTTYGSAEVKAMMGATPGTPHYDVDFYKIDATEGDVLNINIDGAYSSDAPVDTVLAVFGPAPEYKLLRMEDRGSIDSGSISNRDARIDDLVVSQTGEYTIGVSSVPRYFLSGGVSFSFFPESLVKDYTLEISGASATDPVKKVGIEVKPGSDNVAPINPRSRGKIPVAILGASDFRVTNIDVNRDTLTFGPNGEHVSLHKCSKSLEDVNDDGYYDLVCHFNNQEAKFNPDSLEGVLKGTMNNGSQQFEGRAYLKVIPKVSK
jgi:hypothetical protein